MIYEKAALRAPGIAAGSMVGAKKPLKPDVEEG